MYKFKKHTVAILLALFVVSTMASAAIAHCNHAGGGADHPSASEVTGHSMDHDMAGTHHKGTDGDSGSADCFDCEGSLCQTQAIVPLQGVESIFNSTDALQAEKDLDLKAILLTRIPDPPKQLS